MYYIILLFSLILLGCGPSKHVHTTDDTVFTQKHRTASASPTNPDSFADDIFPDLCGAKTAMQSHNTGLTPAQLGQACQQLDTQIQQLIESKAQAILQVLLESSEPSLNEQEITNIIDSLEPEAQEMAKNSVLWKAGKEKEESQKTMQKTMQAMTQEALSNLKTQTQNKLKDIAYNIDQETYLLKRTVTKTVESTKDIDMRPLLYSNDLFEQNITSAAKQAIADKYNNSDLIFLDDPELLNPQEQPLYTFQSPEGEPLEQLKDLYSRIHNIYPENEQGKMARLSALSVIEVTDQFMVDNKSEHQRGYKMAQLLEEIVAGELPDGVSQALYEFFIEKTLMTGEPVKEPALLKSLIVSHFTDTQSQEEQQAFIALLEAIQTDIQNKISAKTKPKPTVITME